MYRVYVENNKKRDVLYAAYSDEAQIFNAVWREEMGKTDTFSFQIAPDHPSLSKLLPLSSEVQIYRDEERDPVFYGPVITPQHDMFNVGTVECLGGMAYLADSMQAPFSYSGTMLGFMEQILSVHNSMVEEKKRLKMGRVNVPGGAIARILEQYMDTLSVLTTMLVAENGGYMRVRQENGIRYLDYLSDYGGKNQQPILFGENVLDLSRQIQAADIITVLIPEGADIDVNNSDGTIGSETVNITSVNGGQNYIQNDFAVEKWGRIWGYAKFEGITDPQILLNMARTYLDRKAMLPEKINLTALDLSVVDINVDALKVGLWTDFISAPHGLSGIYLLQSMEHNLDAPQNDRVSFGVVQQSLSGTTASNQKAVDVKIEKVKQSTSREIELKIDNATQLITGGLGGYFVIGRAEDGHPEETLWMDTPDKQTATYIIRINKNGIGFSTTGIDGPYRNAWTIDGNLVADFVTTGSMLADRIRGGALEVGGTGLGKDGKIMVKDASDKVIGYWDKTGLYVLLGVISGSEIIGSNITGGTINIGSGTFEVNEDGAVTINAGEIDIGNIFYAGDGRIVMGDFRISSDGRNIFQAVDGSIAIQTAKGGPLGEYPVLTIKDKVSESMLTSAALKTSLVNCNTVFLETSEWNENPYNGNVGMILDYIWNDSEYGIRYLGHEVRSLQSQIDDLWDSIGSK